MFSQLGPLFKTVLRQAESADTRLAIRRDEKHDQGRKQDFDSPSDDTSALWEDSTSVSVAALRTFLVEFLKTRGEALTEEETALSAAAIEQHRTKDAVPPPALSARAARAAKAYGAAASHPTVTDMPETDEAETAEEPDINLADLLAADELRTIHRLIHELDILERRGVNMLLIEKAETFLQALVAAVQTEKDKL